MPWFAAYIIFFRPTLFLISCIDLPVTIPILIPLFRESFLSHVYILSGIAAPIGSSTIGESVPSKSRNNIIPRILSISSYYHSIKQYYRKCCGALLERKIWSKATMLPFLRRHGHAERDTVGS